MKDKIKKSEKESDASFCLKMGVITDYYLEHGDKRHAKFYAKKFNLLMNDSVKINDNEVMFKDLSRLKMTKSKQYNEDGEEVDGIEFNVEE